MLFETSIIYLLNGKVVSWTIFVYEYYNQIIVSSLLASLFNNNIRAPI